MHVQPLCMRGRLEASVRAPITFHLLESKTDLHDRMQQVNNAKGSEALSDQLQRRPYLPFRFLTCLLLVRRVSESDKTGAT